MAKHDRRSGYTLIVLEFGIAKGGLTWSEVEQAFGKHLADLMTKSGELRGITVSFNEAGETVIPQSDIVRAYNAVIGRKNHPLTWD